MEQEILRTISYFTIFDYAPGLDEIRTFLKAKASRKKLEKYLEKMVEDRVLTEKVFKNGNFGKLASKRYTLPQYTKGVMSYELRVTSSLRKIGKIEPYIKLISKFPQIKLVGLSGSVAMMNADRNDDIDLFTITAKNRLWTGRFLANLAAIILGMKRARGVERAKDKVCLNLFFDESGLKIPKFKQNEYVAHEILQMKPLVTKGDVYKKFLEVNRWVFDIFPNGRITQLRNANYGLFSINANSHSAFRNSIIGNFVESLLKRLQLWLINRHKTTEIITDHQLWFFPSDFEKKIRG